jgi:hypothetical protein
VLVFKDAELFPKAFDFLTSSFYLGLFIFVVLPPTPRPIQGRLGGELIYQFLFTFAAINVLLKKGLILLAEFLVLGFQSLGLELPKLLLVLLLGGLALVIAALTKRTAELHSVIM